MIQPEWTTKGQITPRKNQGTGNGLLYTAIYIALRDMRNELDDFDKDFANHCFDSCEMKSGLYTRSPGNDQKQESWDDNLGAVVVARVLKDPERIRRVLWYGLGHLGVFNTDGVRKGEDWLWRYFHVWALAVPSAYPIVKWFYYPYAYLLGKTLKADHAGGVMLDWLWFYGFFKLYGKHHANEPTMAQLHAALLNQMDEDHPCNEMTK